MTTTTTTSVTADLPDAMHMAELLENPINVVFQKTAAAVLRHQHSELERLHALAAGQATAAQAVVLDDVAALVRAAQAFVLEPDSHKKKLELEAMAWGHLAAATQPAPVLWLSPEQFANFMDTDEAPFGKYIPARKTSAGKFTMPLFSALAPAQAVAILFEHEDGRYAVNPNTTGDPAWHRLGPVDISALAFVPAQPASSDAYEGAREDLSIWKRRALEAERDLRAEKAAAARLVAELNAKNGPTRMGEPATPLAYGATEYGWTDHRRLEDGDKRLMALIVSLYGNDHQSSSDLEGLLGRAFRATPAQPVEEPAGAVSEMVKFTDQSTANPIEKARRYLTHVANKKPNNPYFFDDGYPRESVADDAAAALSVLEQLAASSGQAPAGAAQAADSVLEDACHAPPLGWRCTRKAEKQMNTEIDDSIVRDAMRYRWLAAHCRSTSEHWGGRWSIVIEGPAPKSHNSEDDFDAAVDAARKQGASQ